MPPQIILNLGMCGENVVQLQRALRQLNFPLEDDEGTFGRSTREAVLKFQRQYRLEPTGMADERTFALINEMVEGKGDTVRFNVSGYVREADGTPFADGRVRVYDQGFRATSVPVGETTTNREGYYNVLYNPQDFGKERINLGAVAVSDADEVISLPHDIVYRAGRDETVDLTIDRAKYRGRPEYVRLLKTARPALGDIPFTELTGPDDVRILAANTGLDTRQIECAVAAARFNARTQLPGELGYLLARRNLPTSPRLLMRRDQKDVRAALEAGVADNLIPAASVDEMLEQLHGRAIEEELEVIPDAGDDYTLGTLFDLSPAIAGEGEGRAERRRAFVETYFQHQTMTDEFWTDLRARPELAQEAIVGEFQFVVELAGLTRAIPLARAVQAELRRGRQSLRPYDLARLDRPTIRRLVESAGVPADQAETRSVEIFGHIEARYPTRVVFHQLERENGELPGAGEMRAFLAERLADEPEFDLGRRHVRAYLGADIDTDKGKHLLSWQRVYRMAPVEGRYETIRILKQMPDLDSSTAVVHIGRGAFMRQFIAMSGDNGRARELAHQVWSNAGHIHAMALSLLSDFSATFNRVTPFAVPHLEMGGEIGNPVSLDELFGSLDFCECQHCESVYSPAAYLADLLHFLQRATPNKDGNSPYGVLLSRRRGDLAKLELSCENTDTLLPYVDLVNEILEDMVAHTPMNLTVKCPDENSSDHHPNRPIVAGYGTALHEVRFNPAVDRLIPENIARLVHDIVPQPGLPCPLTVVGTNEWLLHDKKTLVIPDLSDPNPKLLVYDLSSNQTVIGPETLGVLPQHLRLDAYSRSAREVYPWNLPFDLWFEEARIYLQHLQFKRHLWWERLGRAGLDIARDVLGLTQLEQDLITGTANHAQEKLWGLPQGRTLDDLHGAKFFMRQAGFDIRTTKAFKDVLRLLRGTRYINRNGDLDIPVLDDTCDLACLKIKSGNLPWEETLDRCRRFVRLQRKLGWTSVELDKAITAFQTELTDDFLQHLAGIKRLQADLRVPLVEMFSWWGLLDTAEDRAEEEESKKQKSLYERLFLNRSVELPPDKRLELNPAGTELQKVPEFIIELRPGSVVNDQFVSEAFRRKYAEEHAVALPQIRVQASPNPGEWAILIVPTRKVFWAQREHDCLAFGSPTKITSLIAQVTGALEIGNADLSLIIKGREVPDVLNLESLTRLYRIVSLGRALKLNVRDFLAVKALIGIDPFVSPKSTLEFMERLRRIQSTHFSIGELDYLLRHRFRPTDSYVPTDVGIRRILGEIRGDLFKIEMETRDQTDPDGGLTETRLSLIIEPTKAQKVVDIFGGYTTEVPEDFACPSDVGPELIHNKTARTLTFNGVMTLSEKAGLEAMAANADYREALQDLFEQPRAVVADELNTVAKIRDEILLVLNQQARKSLPKEAVFQEVSAILNKHLRSILSRNLIEQQLGTALGLETDLTKLLMEKLITGRLYKTKPVIEDFLALTRRGLCADKEGPHAFHGLIQAAETDAYRFTVLGPPGIVLELDGTPLHPENQSVASQLRAGEFYELRLTYENDPPKEHRIRWQTTAKSERLVPEDRLLPTDVFHACRTSFILLHKLALLIGKFNLQEDEVRYLADHGDDFGGFDLSGWPVSETQDVKNLFKQWEALRAAFSFRDRYSQRDTRLIEVFRMATKQGAAEARKKLVELTGWDSGQLDTLAGSKGLNLAPDDFKCGRRFNELDKAFRALRQLGISAEQFGTLLAQDLAGQTKALRQIVKAKYGQEEWLKIARPLQDALREKRRAALVSFLLYANCLESANDLYEYYLIDVEMSPCMMTSRIKQAISSVQLFIQRCLMNLESKVTLNADDAQEWKWRKNYRVWEANRKVFLYPENWIEPELRDDKSPFFEELENELLQNEITDENVEQTFLHYLQKLDEVARIEIVGMYEQTDGWFEAKEKQTKGYVLHVFGRTWGEPHQYYYRRWIKQGIGSDHGYWTPWERVDLDIEGDHLIPVVWNRRLYLFWPKFEEKAEEKISEKELPEKFVKVEMKLSEYREGRWSAPKKLSEPVREVPVELEDCHTLTFTSHKNEGRLTLQLIIMKEYGCREPYVHWTLTGQVDNLAEANKSTESYYEFGPSGTKKRSMVFVDESGQREDEEVPFKLPVNVTPKDESDADYNIDYQVIFEQTPTDFRITYPCQLSVIPQYIVGNNTYWPSGWPFFYEDQERTFFVRPVFANLDEAAQMFAIEVFYHPFTGEFVAELNSMGIDGILDPDPNGSGVQLRRQARFNWFFNKYYATGYVWQGGQWRSPVEEIEFRWEGSYSIYNWELFFHIPLMIADRLSKNQRFEEAMRWFHYIFDPTETSGGDAPARFWKVKPFYDLYQQQDGPSKRIQELMKVLNSGDPAIEEQVAAWQDSPFKPHLIARRRIEAYMKTVVMKYIDNLIAWGDQLFRRDTIESINEATQLYVLASRLLGMRPQEIPLRKRPNQSYSDMELKLDAFSNALIKIQEMLPEYTRAGKPTSNSRRQTLEMLYFCIPYNENLLKYWDTVADRLFKIRHCMNIEGVVRQLPLFEPPIDPALLVRAAAAGIDIGSVMNDLYASRPHYRFNIIVQKATELCSEVKSLGAALLAALEKKDAEELALLRSQHEIKLLEAVKEVRKRQIEEAKDTLKGIEKSKELAGIKHTYYEKIQFMNANEKAHLNLMAAASILQAEGQMMEMAASTAYTVPDGFAGGAGMCSPLTFTLLAGGSKEAPALQAFGRCLGIYSSFLSSAASTSATLGGYQRRADDWKLQEQLAAKEIEQIEKQALAGQIRLAMAENELGNHEMQIENAKEVEAWMRVSKFTNKQLYSWMVSQLSTLYFQSYQLAYDLAKRAEKAYCHELGLGDVEAGFIKFGYWDSMKKGLLAGEHLSHDLKRMEVAYLEQNKREYELTKHISLVQLDPIALLQLKQTGVCFLNLPEAAFDLDCPGHYMRRIKSVGLTIPCVTGPYTGVNCKLTLLKSSVRKESVLIEENDYPPRPDNDFRFEDNLGALQSIVTSSAQNDSGLFETNLRDERYLPFEGAGAISEWQLELPADPSKKEPAQFDYSTINDVILHVRYTARDGGGLLRNGAIAYLKELIAAGESVGSTRLLSVRHEFPAEWARFTTQVPPDNHRYELKLNLLPEHYPFWSQVGVKALTRIEVIAVSKATQIDIADKADKSDETAKIDSLTSKHVSLSGLLVGSFKEIALPPPEGDLSLFVDDNSLSDLWLGLTWRAE